MKAATVVAHTGYTGSKWKDYISKLSHEHRHEMRCDLEWVEFTLGVYSEMMRMRPIEVDTYKIKKEILNDVLSKFKPVQDKAKELNDLMIKLNQSAKKSIR